MMSLDDNSQIAAIQDQHEKRDATAAPDQCRSAENLKWLISASWSFSDSVKDKNRVCVMQAFQRHLTEHHMSFEQVESRER